MGVRWGVDLAAQLVFFLTYYLQRQLSDGLASSVEETIVMQWREISTLYGTDRLAVCRCDKEWQYFVVAAANNRKRLPEGAPTCIC